MRREKHRKLTRWLWPYLAVVFILMALLAPMLTGTGRLIPYESSDIALSDAYLPPFSDSHHDEGRHLLGTDALGRDVLAGILSGSRSALINGLLTVLGAGFLGFLLGGLGALLGDRWRLSRWVLWSLLWMMGGAIYVLAFPELWGQEGSGMPLLIFLLGGPAVFYLTSLTAFGQKRIAVPLDSMLLRWYEIFRAVPALLLLLVLATLLRIDESYGLIPLLIFLIWPSIARIIRGEVYRIKEEPFLLQARISGASIWTILWKHVFPVLLGPLLVSMVFAYGAVIILEATLSFLGILNITAEMSWGGMLSDGRSQLRAWWLSVFPGLALFLFLMMLQSLRRWIQ